LAALINLGATITPFGAPQNVLIWVHYKLDFCNFLALFPFTLVPALAASLLLQGRRGKALAAPLDVTKTLLGLTLIAASAALVREDLAAPALALSLALYFLAFRSLPRIDLKLLAILALMMYDFGIVGSVLKIAPLGELGTFLLVAGLSQAISNVPATIIAVASGSPWRPVLLGADLGGLGTPVASLANLIAIRLANCNVKEFTKVNAALLAVALLWASILLILGF